MNTARFVLLVMGAIVALSQVAGADPIITSLGGLPRTLYKHSYALIIGESNYEFWPKLTDVPAEISRLVPALQRQGFVPANIIVRNDVPWATLYQTITAFVAAHGDPQGRILIYFAGHSATNKTQDVGYIVPVDAPAQTNDSIGAKAVSLDVIKAILMNSTAKHTLMIFDSCFSGSVFLLRGNTVPDEITAQTLQEFEQPRVQVITSGDADQTVPGDSEFVDALIAGMDGGARYMDNSVITAQDLSFWLSHNVRETTVRYGSAGKQTSGMFMFVPQGGTSTRNEGSTSRSATAEAASESPSTTQQDAGDAAGTSPSVTDVKQTGSLNSKYASIDQIVAAESKSAFEDLSLFYYKKAKDGQAVLNALDRLGVNYQAQKPQVPDSFPINALACNERADVGKLKSLATGLLSQGVPVRMIYRYRRSDPGPKVVELVTFRVAADRALDTPVLTSQEVSQMTSCPCWLWHGQRFANQAPPGYGMCQKFANQAPALN